MIEGVSADRLLPALGQRERAVLGAMLASRRIGSAEIIAANRWLGAWSLAEHGARDAASRGTSTGVRMLAQERQVTAATDYREAKRAIGVAADRRLRMLLGEGLSMSALATRLDQPDKVVFGMVAADLQRLAEHYTNAPSRIGDA